MLAGVRVAEQRLPYLAPVTDPSPSSAIRHRAGLSDRDGGDRFVAVLVATAAAEHSLATLAQPGGIGCVGPATAHSARILLASSQPDTRRVAPGSPEILTPARLNLREASVYGHS